MFFMEKVLPKWREQNFVRFIFHFERKERETRTFIGVDRQLVGSGVDKGSGGTGWPVYTLLDQNIIKSYNLVWYV